MRFANAPMMFSAPQPASEYVTCHNHGCFLDTSDPSVVVDSAGRYFCNIECHEEWLEEQEEAEVEKAVAAVA